MKRAALLAGLCWALSGCALWDAVGPDAGPLLRTDSTRYVLRTYPPDSTYTISTRRMTVGYTFTNRTGHDVQATGCARPEPPLIEKHVHDEWVVVYGGVAWLCIGPPVPIAEGKSYRSVIQVLVPLPGVNAIPQWGGGDVGGTYRLRWVAVSPVSDVQRTSNEFTVIPG